MWSQHWSTDPCAIAGSLKDPLYSERARLPDAPIGRLGKGALRHRVPGAAGIDLEALRATAEEKQSAVLRFDPQSPASVDEQSNWFTTGISPSWSDRIALGVLQAAQTSWRCNPQNPILILNHHVNVRVRGTVLCGEGMNLSIFQQIYLGQCVANP
jgi:hypothetical protein